MEPLHRSPYDWDFDEINYEESTGRTAGDDEPNRGAYSMQNVLSSVRASANFYSRQQPNTTNAVIDGVHSGDLTGTYHTSGRAVAGHSDDADGDDDQSADPIDTYLMDDDEEGPQNAFAVAAAVLTTPIRKVLTAGNGEVNWKLLGQIGLGLMALGAAYVVYQQASTNVDIRRPDFVNQHPYVSSSYYASTQSLKTLLDTERLQVRRIGGKAAMNGHNFKARVAVVRPFCEFDAEALPSTFAVWNQLPPCRASATDLDLDVDMETNRTRDGERYFDDVGTEIMRDMVADVFLFYSQTFSENEVAIKAVDTIIDQFNEPGSWSQCFANIYAIEANIPRELDLYIPSAQEELYNWVVRAKQRLDRGWLVCNHSMIPSCTHPLNHPFPCLPFLPSIHPSIPLFCCDDHPSCRTGPTVSSKPPSVLSSLESGETTMDSI